MKKLIVIAAALAISAGCSAPAVQIPPEPPKPPSKVMLVYPKEGATISAASTFLIGSVPAGTALTANGHPVRLNTQGFFAHVVQLKPGKNTFNLVLAGSDTTDSTNSRSLNIVRETPPAPISPKVAKIDTASIEPKEDLGVTAGDIVPFSVRATPGAQVSLLLGGKRLPMRPLTSAVNKGAEAAYGVIYQRSPARSPENYVTFYKVQPGDRWQNLIPKFSVMKNGKTVSAAGKGKITVIEQPLTAHTVHAQTIVRLGPGQARTTPAEAGVRFLVDGWVGNSMRLAVSNNRHFWILKEDLAMESVQPAPTSVVRTVNQKLDPHGLRIAVPLTQRLPYEVEQQLNPNRLSIKIYGATSDTDWITPSREQENDLVDHVTWKQLSDRVYQVTAWLKGSRQWGYWVDYDDSTLNLHIKSPPNTVADPDSLQGLTICVDPGHGGDETGAIGPSGIQEKTINLAIATQLRSLLEQAGAKVIMTRTSDEEAVSLGARVDMAIRGNADLLLSIHGNALPDGRDPWTEHGTSTYWYHPQAIEYAKTLKPALIKEVGFPNWGTFYQNLALTRPTNMPSSLVEVGFVINPDEYAQLITPEVQERAARGLLQGIKDYLKR